MSKSRMEAFSDGVIAILITIMVLELTGPHEPTMEALRPLIPTFLSYVLSFIYLGIYWNNHHHLIQAVQHVNGRVLWANLHLLFWLSLVPFVTSWMGENHFASTPVALYGGVLVFAGIAYYMLTRALIALHGRDSAIATALGSDFKGKISVVLYFVAIPMAFVSPWIACGVYFSVAIIWLIPDRRIEMTLNTKMEYSSLAELEAGLDEIRKSPADLGTLKLIVSRPSTGMRKLQESANLDPAVGLVGDNWRTRGSSDTKDGSSHPDMQINMMNSRAAALVARHPERWAEAGDQLYVDMNLGAANLPPGTQLEIGTAVLEVTAVPHTGCRKFTARFGRDATKFVNSPAGRELNLRGINARVVQPGVIRTGDLVKKRLHGDQSPG